MADSVSHREPDFPFRAQSCGLASHNPSTCQNLEPQQAPGVAFGKRFDVCRIRLRLYHGDGLLKGPQTAAIVRPENDPLFAHRIDEKLKRAWIHPRRVD